MTLTFAAEMPRSEPSCEVVSPRASRRALKDAGVSKVVEEGR